MAALKPCCAEFSKVAYSNTYEGYRQRCKRCLICNTAHVTIEVTIANRESVRADSVGQALATIAMMPQKKLQALGTLLGFKLRPGMVGHTHKIEGQK